MSTPITTGKYKDNETLIYSYLRNTCGFNIAASCAVLSNIAHESSFNHQTVGDFGTSYGLCQWHLGRKTNLINYCKKNGLDYTTVEGQMAYLHYELQTSSYLNVYNKLKNISNSGQGAYDAAYYWCTHFELPAPFDAASKGRERGAEARDKYYPAYSSNSGAGDKKAQSESPGLDIGARIVQQIAKTKIGSPYSKGGSGPDSFDCSGFVYYCYTQAGYSMTRTSAQEIYNTYKDTAQSVSPDSTLPGDLLFYADGGGIYHVAIANGTGGRIHVSSSTTEVIEATSLGSPAYILRLVSGYGSTKATFPTVLIATVSKIESTEYAEISTYDPTAPVVTSNLSSISSNSDKVYGYLLDVTHGGTFKFYIPEFEESAGAKWNSIEIRGRSVPVISYESTSARSVTLSLELFAGVGLYIPGSGETNADTVDRLHKDVAFVKSLEYPDYSVAISRPPATVQLVLGEKFNIVGVVSDVTVSHMKPQDDRGRAMYVKLSFKVTQLAQNPPDYSDIKEENYYIGGSSV